MVLADFDWNNLTWIVFWVFVFGGGSAVVTLINSLAKQWRKVKESEHLAALKQSLVERGMSVEDIERVVKAAPESQEREAQEDQPPVARITAKLAENPLIPPDDLEEIVRAFQTSDPATQRALAHTVEVLCDNLAAPASILAAVRALARPGAATESAPPEQRLRVLWGVFNNSNQCVATFEYPCRKEADALAARLTVEKNSAHFVQAVKEPVEPQKDGIPENTAVFRR